ncbi:hypothetical protein ILUMI_17645 [Ignelater luminosus]|uniref:Peptidase S1 domain-containing protein n=1 Tax=Ignelater luminosus TaxID=2038154 RepID=A0A8K0CQ40_IGNLU|nr:hypothetical protein ILUMI_17645 [Ignelater luminosus]
MSSIIKMKLIIVVVAFIALAQAGSVKPKLPPLVIPRIAGGEEAKSQQYPFMAALFIDEKYFCSGSILSKNKILTAGHCCVGAKSIQVVVGTYNIIDLEASQKTIESDLFDLHPEYDPNSNANDVCIVTLPIEIDLAGPAVKEVKLYEGEDNLEGNEATMLGWGRISDSVSNINPILHHATDTIISNEKCAEFFSNVADSIICMNGHNGRGACFGDFGGPLICNGEQVGIASFGSSWGCSLGFPSGYVRISAVYDWIKKEVERTPEPGLEPKAKSEAKI